MNSVKGSLALVSYPCMIMFILQIRASKSLTAHEPPSCLPKDLSRLPNKSSSPSVKC